MSLLNLRSGVARIVRAAQTVRTFAGEAAQLSDEDAVQKYLSSPQSFKNFPVESISFVPSQYEGQKITSPSLFVNGRRKPGVLHVTPFTRVLFPKFGPTGNLGMPRGYTAGTIDDPKAAENEFALASDGFPTWQQPNELMNEYLSWITALEDKLVKHVVEAYKEYPVLRKRFGSLLDKSEDVRSELIASAITRTVKTSKPSKEGQTPNTFINFRQRIYARASPERLQRAVALTDLDKQMMEAGLVRRRIPVLDVLGNDLGVDTKLFQNDVVSVQLSLDGMMYEVGSNAGFGLRKNIRNVILLRHKPSSPSKDNKDSKDNKENATGAFPL